MNIVLDVLRYLNEHDITLVKAAEATGVAQQNIKKSIGNNPKTSTLLALAKGLGVDPREFFYDLDEEKKKEHTNSTILDESDSWGASDAAEEKKTDTMGQTQEKDSDSTDTEVLGINDTAVQLPDAEPAVNTTTFCPHCGAKVRVGVVLLPEE
jgi:transcriptional regulator with XRE-family HTH domain